MNLVNTISFPLDNCVVLLSPTLLFVVSFLGLTIFAFIIQLILLALQDLLRGAIQIAATCAARMKRLDPICYSRRNMNPTM